MASDENGIDTRSRLKDCLNLPAGNQGLPIKPPVGELGLELYGVFGMRPARNGSDPSRNPTVY